MQRTAGTCLIKEVRQSLFSYTSSGLSWKMASNSKSVSSIGTFGASLSPLVKITQTHQTYLVPRWRSMGLSILLLLIHSLLVKLLLVRVKLVIRIRGAISASILICLVGKAAKHCINSHVFEG